MIAPLQTLQPDTVVYPDSDGKPMAENTLQAEWIVTIMGNLACQYRADPNVFVAMDNFIYAVRGNNTLCTAPDVYVAFGRPKGHRGSYKVWLEDGIFPQVIFEIFSPGNTHREMDEKHDFYFRYGAEEFYIYDPEDNTLEGYIQTDSGITTIDDWATFVSPRMGIRFELVEMDLHIYGANGQRFRTFLEVDERAEQADFEAKRAKQAVQKAKRETERAKKADERAKQADQQTKQADQRADDLAASLEKLRAKMIAAGLDPDEQTS